MKIKEKRNKNKLKNNHKEGLKQKSTEMYKSEYGPYKIVSFVNLGGSMKKIQEDFLDNLTSKMHFDKKNKQNFMFIDTTTMTDIEAAYITRCSDLVVCVVNTTDINDKPLTLIKRHLPACIFVVVQKTQLKNCKKFVKKFIPDQKVVELSALLDFLCIIKLSPTKISSRPFMIPFSCESQSRDILVIKGFMKKGLLTNKVIINGKYEAEVLEVRSDNTIQGNDLGMTETERSKFTTVQNFNENEMEVEESEEMEFIEDLSDEEDLDEEDLSSTNPSLDYPSLIDKYSEYKGIRNLATCDLPTDKFPEHYKNLLFFQDYKHVTKMVTKRESLIPDNQIVEIVLKISDIISDNIFVMFGYYEFEDLNTIHNFSYQGPSLRTGENLFIDMGHKIIEVIPTITKANNQNLYKKEDTLDSGVISFIAPMVFDIHKILIFNYKNLSINNFLSLGINIGNKDRKLYDEVVLEGLPIKIHKRSCTVKRMFYSKEEVMYYKNIKLYTKHGRSHGFIKKPIGVHGAYKAYFSHPIASNEKIYMSLYKRTFLDDFIN